MNLNNIYTFDNFKVNENNKLAFVTCKAIAEYPGNMYNPLYLYGKDENDRGHLLYSIKNFIEENTKLKILYVTTDTFIKDYEEIKDFRKKYTDINILIIDDIQNLEKSEDLEQEFFNIFNELYANDKQIVIGSNCSPDNLNLSQRLSIRFNWGISVGIDSNEEIETNINI